jgi:hypothetical protein
MMQNERAGTQISACTPTNGATMSFAFLEKKIKFMVENPPESRVLNQIAWPDDVLYDSNV